MIHWSGTRSGWNARGMQSVVKPVDQAYYQMEQEQVKNPDSRYWERKAKNVMQDLCDYLGTYDYRLWAELTWPGDSINDKTWQNVHDTALGYWNIREYLHLELHCTCNGVQMPCKVCQASSQIVFEPDNTEIEPLPI